MLKLARPDIQVVATEPVEAQLLAGKEWSPHKLQGWTPDFVADVMNKDIYDDLIPVDEHQSKNASLALASQEGILCGISAGATFAAALETAKKAPEGSVILAMLPDTGERYLSTYLFEDFESGSDDI